MGHFACWKARPAEGASLKPGQPSQLLQANRHGEKPPGNKPEWLSTELQFDLASKLWDPSLTHLVRISARSRTTAMTGVEPSPVAGSEVWIDRLPS